MEEIGGYTELHQITTNMISENVVEHCGLQRSMASRGLQSSCQRSEIVVFLMTYLGGV